LLVSKFLQKKPEFIQAYLCAGGGHHTTKIWAVPLVLPRSPRNHISWAAAPIFPQEEAHPWRTCFIWLGFTTSRYSFAESGKSASNSGFKKIGDNPLPFF